MSDPVHVELSGEMGEKAATNEVISKLLSVLGDESEYVRWSCMFKLLEIWVKKQLQMK